eukprot:TRINITY_DN65266_c1_g1_i6.p3 TRINITY_DN65266_c1_g1~~TRINITY_DN65266_c1_g1_i6.p3  ORF type:complete len:108 (-),score=15.35 TRINITY_DN65266_c1_g1_i6:419-742(-)
MFVSALSHVPPELWGTLKKLTLVYQHDLMPPDGNAEVNLQFAQLARKLAAGYHGKEVPVCEPQAWSGDAGYQVSTELTIKRAPEDSREFRLLEVSKVVCVHDQRGIN